MPETTRTSPTLAEIELACVALGQAERRARGVARVSLEQAEAWERDDKFDRADRQRKASEDADARARALRDARETFERWAKAHA